MSPSIIIDSHLRKIVRLRDIKELPDIYDRRLSACDKLESAETALLRKAAKIRLEANKGKGTEGKAETNDPERNASLAERLVPRDERPTHRLKLGFMPFSLPFVGQKVDSIEWARDEIRVCSELLERGREVVNREDPGLDADSDEADGQEAETKSGHTYPKRNSAFVTFYDQIAAHLALQSLAHHEPYQMSDRYGEMSPQDVIWGNLGLNPYETKVVVILFKFRRNTE